MRHDGWHSFLRVWLWVPVKGSLCLFWCKTHTKGLHMRFPTRPKEDEGRKVPEQKRTGQLNEEGSQKKETSRQNRAVSKRDQSTELNRPGQSTGESSQQRLLGPVDSEARLANMSGWVMISGGNFTQIHAHASPQIHRKPRKSITNVSLLALGTNPSPCLFVLFSSTLSVVYVVFCLLAKKCEIPLARDERNH